MKKILLSPWTALITLALLVSIRVADPSFIESVRLRYFDTLITSKGTTVSQQVQVVNIDDATIRQKGQFPFPRGQYATLIADLYRHGAGLVVFNMYMPDGDRFGQDSQLAQTFKQFPVVLPHVGTTDDIKNKYAPFRPGVSVIGGENAGVNYGNIEPNIKIFNDTAAGVGVVNTLPEIDGVTRRIPMVVQANGQLYPSISLETLRVAAGDPSFQIKVADGAIEAVRIPKFGKLTTDQLGRIWVDWSSRPNQFSASNLPKDFNGSIVIVGVTAKGLNNPVASPIGAIYPHHLQAAVLDTVTSGTNISRPDYADGAEILALILLGVLLLFLTRWTYVGIISGIVIIGSLLPLSQYLYSSNLWLFDSTILIGGLVLVMLHAYGIKFISEFLQKQQIKKQFGTYLSPALVAKLQKNPELLKLGGESRELSIMFTDVRGFTTISEHYGENVQGLTEIMNRYMTAMTEKIIENNGTLDKYIGDAQMAFWNAPLDETNHAKMAVKTALQMMESLDEFNKEIEAEGVPAFGMGLGINTGTVVVGNMGSRQRFDYTCLGDSVNLASRLEGQSKPYGVKIVLGPLTANQVRDEYPVVEMDCIAVKGKKVGVKIYTLGNPNWKHQMFLDSYYSGDWISAKGHCKTLIEENNELKQYYINMLERLEEGLPANWDGTYRATSK
jgi:adenylate cyclase